MALLRITTTAGAFTAEQHRTLACKLGELIYIAEGFGGSHLAPNLTWATFDALPGSAMLLGSGVRTAPLYYVEVTTLAGALDTDRKRLLGEQLTSALLAVEESVAAPDDRNRVWIRFIGVVDGDLIVGGEPTSLAGLRQLVAQAA